ncbi:unnamed protein product [Lota lota]
MGCFHMYACEEEFDFTTEENFDKSWWFALLRARSGRTAPPKAIPLHASEIKDSMFANSNCSAVLREVLEHLERARSSDPVLTETNKVLEIMAIYKGSHNRDSTEIPETSFALAVYIHPYPNYILST